MKIGILTFHRAYNCGAVLQAWALMRAIEKMGHRAAVVDCNRVGAESRFHPFNGKHHGLRQLVSRVNHLRMQALSLGPVDLRRHRFRRFCAANLNLVSCGVRDLSRDFDKLVFGSDQIWNPNLMSEEDTALFYGESVSASIPKIAYAASIGDNPLSEHDHLRLVRASRTFEAISVREKLAGEGLLDKFGRAPVEVVDPSLLLTKEDYLPVARPERMKRGKYILVYALCATPFVCACAEKASRSLGMPYVILAMYQYGWNNRPANVICGFGPAEFLAWYRDADAVMASSFHGTAFALIFGKPFVSLCERVNSNGSRVAALLTKLSLEDRIVCTQTSAGWVRFLRARLSSRAEGEVKRLADEGRLFLKRV